MKKLILLSLCLFLGACTKTELKNRAVKQAEFEYAETLTKELDGMTMPGRLLENYFSFLKTTASYEVIDAKITDSTAVVSVRQEAVAAENRRTLAQIASTLDSSKVGGFNMGNAINLIEQQPGQVKGKRETLYFIKFRKSGDEWQLDGNK